MHTTKSPVFPEPKIDTVGIDYLDQYTALAQKKVFCGEPDRGWRVYSKGVGGGGWIHNGVLVHEAGEKSRGERRR